MAENTHETEHRRADDFFAELRAKTEDLPGVTRPSYGEGEATAHAMAADWARDLDMEISHDAARNQYMTLPGRDRSAAAVMIGSHMDSVPHGGNFDGAAGVIMGLAACARMRRLGYVPVRDVTVMAIRAEEACWFATHYAGSRMAFGLLPGAERDSLGRSDNEISLSQHIAEAGGDPDALKSGTAWLDPARIHCFIEPHIEQGPALVGAGVPVGIVTGIRGNLRYRRCRVLGDYAHAGAVPRDMRKDAVFAAVEFAAALERHWDERDRAGTDFVCTMGEFWTDPSQHVMTKIAGDVRFTMDIRSIDNAVLMETDAHLREVASAIAARRGLSIELGAYSNAEPAIMDEGLRADLRAAGDDAGIAWLEMASGAGHDCATFASMGVPAAMLFIRNEHGSHNPHETMEMADFVAASRVLSRFLERIDER